MTQFEEDGYSITAMEIINMLNNQMYQERVATADKIEKRLWKERNKLSSKIKRAIRAWRGEFVADNKEFARRVNLIKKGIMEGKDIKDLFASLGEKS